MNTSLDVNSTTLSNEFCQETTGNILLICESVVVILVSFLVILVHSLFIHILAKSGGFVPNSVKVQLCSLSIGLICRMIAFMIFAAESILLTFWRGKFVPTNFLACSIFVYVHNVPCSVGYLELFLIGVERAWQTFSPEKPVGFVKQLDFFGFFILTSSWFVPIFAFTGIFLRNFNQNRDNVISYCTTESIVGVISTSIFNAILIFILTLSLCFYFWAKTRSEHLLENSLMVSSAWHHLHSRFFLANNLKMIKSILPIACLHAIVSGVVLLMGNISRSIFGRRTTTDKLLFRTLYFLIHATSSLLLPILMIRYLRFLMKNVNYSYKL